MNGKLLTKAKRKIQTGYQTLTMNGSYLNRIKGRFYINLTYSTRKVGLGE